MFKVKNHLKSFPHKSLCNIVKRFKATKEVCSIDNPYTLEVIYPRKFKKIKFNEKI